MLLTVSFDLFRAQNPEDRLVLKLSKIVYSLKGSSILQYTYILHIAVSVTI